MGFDTEEPPRPPRSLRGRLGAREAPQNQELLPTDYIKNNESEPEKPSDFDESAQSYLSQLEDLDEEEISKRLEDDEDEQIPVNKPKVTVLNVREKKISTDEVKKDTKKVIEKEVEKVKEEFQKVEEIVEEAKEELTKVKDKIAMQAALLKAKAMEFGIRVFDSVLTFAKDFALRIRFKKKKEKPEQSSENITKAPIKPEQTKNKKIPKIKYGSLLAQGINFLTYDKRPLADSRDSGAILEEIFMANTIADIRYCIKYVTDLPFANKGIYANRPIVEIFEHITPEDINNFLYYVSNNPEPFVGNNYKFSEAFATWIIRKSHEI